MDWLRYSNQNAVRNQALSPNLLRALSFVPDMGLSMEVFSGGQPGKGTSPHRVGSTRHDHGNAADVFFYQDGRKLDWANEQDLPTFEEIVRRARANGITGIGAGPGYMQPGSMHIGFGDEAIWGDNGLGVNAPEWLRNAWAGNQSETPPTIVNNQSETPPTIANNQSETPPTTGRNRQKAPTLFGGGANDTLEPEMDQQMAGGIFGRIFPNATADQQDQTALALMSLGNVNPGAMQAVQSRMNARRDDRKESQSQQQAQQQANRTAQVLQQQGAPDYLVQMAQSGMAREAFAEFARMQRPQAGPQPTDDMREYNMAVQQGFQGTLLDYMTQVRNAGATQITNNVGSSVKPLGNEGQILIEDPSEASGYRVEVAPGSKLDSERKDSVDSVVAKAEISRGLIGEIMGDPALASITGMIQGRIPPLSQAGTDLNVKIEQLKSRVFLEAFETLKGGGQITEREGAAAQAAMARLDRAQSTEEFVSALQELDGILQRGLSRVGAPIAPVSQGQPALPQVPDFTQMSDEELDAFILKNGG